MATQTIDATLFASSHPDIAKRTSVSGLLISCGDDGWRVILIFRIYF